MLHSGENQQPRHDPSFSQGQRFQFNGVPKTPSPVTNPDLDKKKELDIPELEPPKDFQVQVLAAVRAITKDEGGISGSQAHEIVAQKARETVWLPICQAVQHNARIVLDHGQNLIGPFQGKSQYHHQYQQLDDTIRLILKGLDLKNPEIDSTAHHDNLAQLNNEQAPAAQTGFSSEQLTQEQTDLLVYNVTRTGSAKDPYFPAGITSNKILGNVIFLLSPVYVVDIAAAILIQSADRDVMTAGVTGLIFVILSTIPFVFSAYYFAILKGHQKYKEAYYQNFPSGFKHPQTGHPEPFVELQAWVKEMAYGGLICGILALGMVSAYRFSIIWKAEDGLQNHMPEVMLITAIILLTMGIFFYKASTFPSLPLEELNRYYELRKRVPHLIPLPNEKSLDPSEAALVQTEDVDKSDDHPLINESPTQMEEALNLKDLQDVKLYYQQHRSNLQEGVQAVLRELTKVSDKMNQLGTVLDDQQKRAQIWLDLQWGILRDTLQETGTHLNPLNESNKQQFFDLYLGSPVESKQMKALLESIKQVESLAFPVPLDLDSEYAQLKRQDKSIVVFGQAQTPNSTGKQ